MTTTPAASAADLVWTASKAAGRPMLTAMPDEPEVDYEFWARCRADRSIDVGVGAEWPVGTGKGETVTVTFTGAGQTITLRGRSRRSDNSEMTGGIELRATVGRDHPLFAILATAAPIRVEVGKKRHSLDGKTRAARTRQFLKFCEEGR